MTVDTRHASGIAAAVAILSGSDSNNNTNRTTSKAE